MNLFFVVEGKRAEKILYKNWIHYLHPELTFVPHISELTHNSFSVLSGKGQPHILDVVKRAFLDIASLGNIDYLFICLDSEDLSYIDKLKQVESFVNDECPVISCEIEILIQNHCIETWLMGNKRLNIGNTGDPELKRYKDFYNVNIYDPEDLEAIDQRSIGKFTERYFKLMLREKDISYSKQHVGQVGNKGYFIQLAKRNRKDGHINSFGYFLDSMQTVKISLL
jgi:hypothetical protein